MSFSASVCPVRSTFQALYLAHSLEWANIALFNLILFHGFVLHRKHFSHFFSVSATCEVTAVKLRHEFWTTLRNVSDQKSERSSLRWSRWAVIIIKATTRHFSWDPKRSLKFFVVFIQLSFIKDILRVLISQQVESLSFAVYFIRKLLEWKGISSRRT